MNHTSRLMNRHSFRKFAVVTLALLLGAGAQKESQSHDCEFSEAMSVHKPGSMVHQLVKVFGEINQSMPLLASFRRLAQYTSGQTEGFAPLRPAQSALK